MKTFLKPLTPEEEKYYLQEYKQGSLEAKDILIQRNLRLVAHIVKKYQGAGEELDDLISIGTIGLIKAIQTFDFQKASRLSTYAARCIDNELLMLLRSKKKSSKEVSLYEPIGTDKEGNEISLLDVTAQEMPDIVVELVAVVPIFVLIPIPFMLVLSSLVAVAVHIHTIPLIKLLVVLVEELAVSMDLTIVLHILLG